MSHYFTVFMIKLTKIFDFLLVTHLVLTPGIVILYNYQKRSKKIRILFRKLYRKLKKTYIPQIAMIFFLMFLRSFFAFFMLIVVYLFCAYLVFMMLKLELIVISQLFEKINKLFNGILSYKIFSHLLKLFS